MPINRRTFLQSASVVGCAATAGFSSVGLREVAAKPTEAIEAAAAPAPFDLPIIDTHQHLWDLIQYQPPWLSGAPASIAGKHDMAVYLAETEGLNVVKAVYMEVDVAPVDQVREAEYVLGLINSGKTPTVAAVISGRPDSEAFASYIQPFGDNAFIKGVRQVLHAGSAERGLCLRPQFVRSIQLLGEMGKSFDLCMRPTELADGAKLVDQCPDTRFVLDHCGNADVQAWRPVAQQVVSPQHTVDDWKRDIEQLAKRENIVCKISGIIARAPQDWTTEDLAPAINFCLDSFGPDRVMFGGDWPVCKLGASYADWVAALKSIVADRSESDQRKLFHDNAEKFYGI